MEFFHESVLLRETIDLLHIRPDGTYFDGTLGGAGHSFEIAKQLGKNGRLIGVDRDGEAIEAAAKRLAPFRENVMILRDDYRNFPEIADREAPGGFDGILLDIGVSSHQFDDRDRGFSYRFDGPLDMRMDRRSELTAAIIVNEYPEERLRKILYEYGEEPYAARIASRIVSERKIRPIETTFQLSDIVKSAVPAKILHGEGHPAKQTFQALRIECNGELDALKESLDAMIDRLKTGGRIAVITFHSLEDRIVKNAFRTAEDPCTCPKEFPVCVCGKRSKGRVVTRKPVTASEEELNENHRAKSAKLRVFLKDPA